MRTVHLHLQGSQIHHNRIPVCVVSPCQTPEKSKNSPTNWITRGRTWNCRGGPRTRTCSWVNAWAHFDKEIKVARLERVYFKAWLLASGYETTLQGARPVGLRLLLKILLSMCWCSLNLWCQTVHPPNRRGKRTGARWTKAIKNCAAQKSETSITKKGPKKELGTTAKH